MLLIDENKISLTRGDDAVLDIRATTATGEAYAMQDGDVLTLTVRGQPRRDAPVLMQIDSAPGSSRIVIRHEDTAQLSVGRFSADVQLKTADGARFTVWPQLTGAARYRERNFENFIIMPEVTTI